MGFIDRKWKALIARFHGYDQVSYHKDYDSHVQYFAGRVHLRSLVFLSARAARACRTRPRVQFSLV